MKYISRTVWVLSVVSFLTDTASEMLYPIMPLYLQSIGFSVVLIGVLEGLAEATAGLSKGYFGKLSDFSGRRVPFVQLGYAMSSISKPLMAAFSFPLWIFFVRTIDRFGKGIRTGARDALLSAESTPQTKGKIFGFHRSMDTLGAALGPALALLFLYFYPSNYRTLFLLAFIPGILAVFASLLLSERQSISPENRKRPSFFSFLGYWRESPLAYKRLVAGLLIFTLVNSSDVFLLLQLKQVGLSDTAIIGVYIFYNLVYALFAFPMGMLADKVGLKTVFLIGLALFAAVYAGMAFGKNLYTFIALFFVYGVYAAATEGISKAWITNISRSDETATAIGTFSALQSICTLLASSLAGLIWYRFGANTTFLLSAVVAVVVMLYVFTVPAPNENKAN